MMETPLETSKLIFDKLFMCRVPVLSVRSEMDVMTFGTVFTGNEDIDKSALDEWVTVMWSITRMASMYKKGFGIKVIKADDTKTIYEYVSRHLEAWRRQLEEGMHGGKAPFDDLILLDEFANTVYTHVKYDLHKAPPPIESIMDKYLKEKSIINKQTFADIFSNVRNERKTDSIRSKQTIEDRKGYDEFFKGKVIDSQDHSLNQKV